MEIQNKNQTQFSMDRGLQVKLKEKNSKYRRIRGLEPRVLFQRHPRSHLPQMKWGYPQPSTLRFLQESGHFCPMKAPVTKF